MNIVQSIKVLEHYNILADGGYYNKAAYVIAVFLGLKMKVGSSEYKKHFQGDKDSRCVFKITLFKGGKQYTFDFGQSIAEDSNEPTLYNVLACLQKYDVGSFEEFCDNYGYNNDSRSAHKIYKAVCKEYENMNRLFRSEELELLSNIN